MLSSKDTGTRHGFYKSFEECYTVPCASKSKDETGKICEGAINYLFWRDRDSLASVEAEVALSSQLAFSSPVNVRSRAIAGGEMVLSLASSSLESSDSVYSGASISSIGWVWRRSVRGSKAPASSMRLRFRGQIASTRKARA